MSQSKGDLALWDQLWSNLKDRFTGNFQLQLPFSSYYWEDPKPGYIDYRTYNLFNQKPLWNLVGERDVSATGVYESYGTVIQFAPKFVATPHQQQELKDLESQINRARSDYSENVQASFTAFETEKRAAERVGIKLDYDIWMVKSGWEDIIQSNQLLVDKLLNQKAAVLNQYPDNKEVLEAYTPPDPSAAYTDKAFFKCFINSKEYWRAAYEAPSPHTIINMLSKGGQPLEFNFDSLESSISKQHSWAGGNASYNKAFFRIYAGGSWEKFDLDENTQSVSLVVKFDKIDRFPVRCGDWYNGVYLSSLKKANNWASGYSEESVFGKKGLLPLIATDFIAAIGMTVTVQVSQSSFKKNQEKFEASGGIQIGPFRFGGSGGSSSEKWERKAANSSFTIKLNDEYPYIIGFMVARADGEPLNS